MSEVIVDVPTRYKELPIDVMDELVSLKEENLGGTVVAKHSNHYSALYCMADDEEREEVVQSLAAVCYNYGISVDEIAGEMTKLTLLNEPKKRNRFIMLPKEDEC